MIFTIPNWITIFGMVLTILYIVSYTYELSFIYTFGFLGGAFLTDALDGHLARKLNKVSSLGKILDPVRDRMILAAFFLHVITRMQVSFREFSIILFICTLESIVWLTRVAFYLSYRIRLETNVWGKIRQFFHVLIIAIVVVRFQQGETDFLFEVKSMLVFSLAAWLAYTKDGWNFLKVVHGEKAS